MSIAIIDPVPLSYSATTVAILGAGAADRTRAAALLAGAGFDVRPAGSPADLGGWAALVVVLGQAAEATRVGEVRTVAAAHPDLLILAVVPSDARAASLRRTLLAGATGIVLDDALEDALAATASAVLAGQLTVPVRLSRLIAPQPLSHRERQVLDLVVLGMTNQQIANRLFLAESTVKTHLSSAFRKLDARSRSEAVARLQDPEAAYGLGIPAPTELTAVPAGP